MLTRLRIGLDRARDLREAGRPSPIQPRPLPSELVDLSAQRATWRVVVPGQPTATWRQRPPKRSASSCISTLKGSMACGSARRRFRN